MKPGSRAEDSRGGLLLKSLSKPRIWRMVSTSESSTCMLVFRTALSSRSMSSRVCAKLSESSCSATVTEQADRQSTAMPSEALPVGAVVLSLPPVPETASPSPPSESPTTSAQGFSGPASEELSVWSPKELPVVMAAVLRIAASAFLSKRRASAQGASASCLTRWVPKFSLAISSRRARAPLAQRANKCSTSISETTGSSSSLSIASTKETVRFSHCPVESDMTWVKWRRLLSALWRFCRRRSPKRSLHNWKVRAW
mmetsp:Transcript_47962/g.86260  ORF Transcript_47962/g.86260 Transcript_47962/m.86260 type:complete len:256 (-) Transcript_47962:18-785(-)